MINDEEIKRIHEMQNTSPIENPCPTMDELGYTYHYHKGLVDKTPHYIRVEEDCIVYTGEKYLIQFNLASRCVVLIQREDNADCYGGRPTLFLDNDLLKCINEIRMKLGWDE